MIKLDLGCGKNKISPDYLGVDSIAFPGVDVVLDLTERLPIIPPSSAYSDHKEMIKYIQDIHNSEKNPKFKPWPWEDNSVDEIHCSHFVEHLTAPERIHFVNEAYRVLKPGADCKVITPHWASSRAYGDLTHQWPPIAEFFFYYLSTDWRSVNAPHNEFYKCNFICTWGYSLREDLLVRNQEYQMFALSNFKEAALDIIANLKKA